MKQVLANNIKNLPGWRTNEKLVIFSVDDYGNARVDSLEARERMLALGLNLDNQFDRFDALETTQDLEALFETLDSVQDKHNCPAKFTPYAVCANPDFSRMRQDGSKFYYEPLKATFSRLSQTQGHAYEGAWALWQEGMEKGFLRPQFHGREHLNLDVIERKLASGDAVLQCALENDSLTGLEPEPTLPGVGFTAGFAVFDGSDAEIKRHESILADGLGLFEDTFGFKSTTFTPPAQQLNPALYTSLESLGVQAIDKPLRCVRRLDRYKNVKEWNFLGTARGYSHLNLVRNVVFEPGKGMVSDPVSYALKQVETAFRWHKPAIISSHRVNFCGHISSANRKQGLAALKALIKEIVRRWPDVQFISADELVNKIKEPS